MAPVPVGAIGLWAGPAFSGREPTFASDAEEPAEEPVGEREVVASRARVRPTVGDQYEGLGKLNPWVSPARRGGAAAGQKAANFTEREAKQVEPAPPARVVYVGIVLAEADAPDPVARAGLDQHAVAGAQ